MSNEPIDDVNDTPLDRSRYKQWQKENGEECVKATTPVAFNINSLPLGEKYFCLPKTFPTDLDGAGPKDTMCKKGSEWIEQVKEKVPGLTPIGLSYWILFLRELTGYASQQECEQNCQKRWFCNNNDEECELLDAQNEDGSFRPGPFYTSKEECEDNCPTAEPPSETPSPS